MQIYTLAGLLILPGMSIRSATFIKAGASSLLLMLAARAATDGPVLVEGVPLPPDDLKMKLY